MRRVTELESEERAAATALPSCAAAEQAIREIWREHLGREVSPYDDFFELGGDSLMMIEVVLAARQRGLPVKSSQALRNPSPARLAESLTLFDPASAGDPRTRGLEALCAQASASAATRSAGWCAEDTRPVPVIEGDAAEPLYVIHSDSHVHAEREAVRGWGIARPVRGFLLPGVRGPIPPYESVGEITGRYLTALQIEQPIGPYRVAGFGLGAPLAFDMALRLRADGEKVAALVLINPAAAGVPAGLRAQYGDLLRQRFATLAGRFGLTGDESVEQIHADARRDGWYDDAVRPADLPRLQLAWAQMASAVQAYQIADYDGPAVLAHDGLRPDAGERTWQAALKQASVHQLDYGLESPLAVIADTGLARTMRKVLGS